MNKISLRVFASVLVLVLATLACATPDINALLNPLPNDDFSSDSSGWGTGTDSNASVEYLNDGLTFLVFTPFYVTWSTPNPEVYENTHLEVSVSNQGSDPEAVFGFICNEQGTTNAFYYVGVSTTGYYAFIKSSVAVDDIYLAEGNSEVISGGNGSMRLGLDCKYGSMTLYVNGQMIQSVTDSSYPNGSVGLFVASDDENNGAIVIFDDFAMKKLGE
jgi:hypothetical protein